MATIVGGILTSHVPAIGRAIALELQQDPYWKPFFDGFPPVREWLARQRPDVVVVFYNDHGLNFFLDKMPTFAIGAAPSYSNADEGWGIPQVPAFKGEQTLSWHLIEALVAHEFDPVTCQEMLVDHAFTLPMALLWPDQQWPVTVVPVNINTVQFPLPSAKRCYDLGATIGQAKRPHVLRLPLCALRCTVVQTQRALTSRILLPLPWCGPTEPFAAGARYIGSTASAVRWHGS